MTAALRRGAAAYVAELRRFSPDARRYLWGVLLLGIGNAIFTVLRNPYLEDLGYSRPQITAVQGISSAAGLAVALVAPLLLGALPARRLLVGLALLNGAGNLAQALARDLGPFYAAAALAGTSLQLQLMAAAPLLMRVSSPRERLHLFGMNIAVSFCVSGVIGSSVAGVLARWLTGLTGSPLAAYRGSLVLGALVGLGAALPLARLGGGPLSAPIRSTAELFRLRAPRRALAILVPEAIVGLGAGLTIPFLQLYFKSTFGLGLEAIGYLFTVMMAVGAAGFVLVPLVVRRLGLPRTILAVQLASLPFFLELALASHLGLAAAAFIARATLMNMASPVYAQLAQESTPAEDRAKVAILEATARQLLFMAGNFASGFLQLLDGGRFRIVVGSTIVLYVVAISIEALVFPHLARARLDQQAP